MVTAAGAIDDDHGQGFPFSRPLDVDAIEAFLQTADPTPLAQPTR
jgi:EAL domain-containing protein (putative c-di-GMP-specific phosphodiesterase class I)